MKHDGGPVRIGLVHLTLCVPKLCVCRIKTGPRPRERAGPLAPGPSLRSKTQPTSAHKRGGAQRRHRVTESRSQTLCAAKPGAWPVLRGGAKASGWEQLPNTGGHRPAFFSHPRLSLKPTVLSRPLNLAAGPSRRAHSHAQLHSLSYLALRRAPPDTRGALARAGTALAALALVTSPALCADEQLCVHHERRQRIVPAVEGAIATLCPKPAECSRRPRSGGALVCEAAVASASRRLCDTSPATSSFSRRRRRAHSPALLPSAPRRGVRSSARGPLARCT